MTVVFCAGACMYQLRTIWRPRLAIAWLVTILAVGGLWWSGVQEIAATLGLPVLVVLAGTAATPVLRRAGRFGDISYGLYIYAFPVQQTWVWLGGRGMSFAVGVLCCTAITVVLAWLSWRLVEQPALKLKPRGARPRPGPVA
jgi:peptidoglycan/LPS O-acetylase OafA/YrhL